MGTSRRTDASQTSAQTALRLILAGRVQGLGVRPAIVHLARSLDLAGVVSNTNRGVEIVVEGSQETVAEFSARLRDALPNGARVDRLEREAVAPRGQSEFVILHGSPTEPPAARFPPDMVVCADCLADIADTTDRRHGYPFTSCTACGPRYTMICEMPYERDVTTMRKFPLCRVCEAEYTTPGDRRFHAQSTACPDCGPIVWCGASNRTGVPGGACVRDTRLAGAGAVPEAVEALLGGQIVAVRGVGGYQLLVDATDAAAVQRLRDRKHRRAKPLAVMVASLADAQRLAFIDDAERAALTSRANPIVLLRARGLTRDRGGREERPVATEGTDPSPPAASPLAAGVHPGLDTVGLLLPTTPLHAIIAREVGRPLVCTSGNREGEPLEYEVPGAERRLAGICDLFLHHNRPIARPIDDSVVRVVAGRPVTIRLARGLAPLALDLPASPPRIAVGGHLKGAIAWSNGAQAVLGPHVGDQENLANRERLLATVDDAKQLFRFEPQQIAHDMHPHYFTTQWALQERARQEQVRQEKVRQQPVRQDSDPNVCVSDPQACVRKGLPEPVAAWAVQHHHAHVAAGMLEHGWLDRTVLGVAWDGTGYGTDGTIWGGEFLMATASRFERVASLRPFRLPGGEAAVRQPWRIVAAMLSENARGTLEALFGSDVPAATRTSVLAICEHPRFSTTTTSAGRLFDAAAAIALGKTESEFDGQPAMYLEAAADATATGHYALPIRSGRLKELDWRPLVAALVQDRLSGQAPGAMAMRFHRGVARGIVDVCRLWPDWPVVLTGGVFQNRLLTELVLEYAGQDGRPWGPPGVIPPGDGGLAAGQLVVASHQDPCR